MEITQEGMNRFMVENLQPSDLNELIHWLLDLHHPAVMFFSLRGICYEFKTYSERFNFTMGFTAGRDFEWQNQMTSNFSHPI